MGAVAELNRNLSNATRALPVIAESLVSHVQEVFEQEGAVGGAPRWQDLAPSTKRKRRGGAVKALGKKKRIKGAREGAISGKFTILQDTGVLAGSISRGVGSPFVEAYTGVRYAVYHVSKLPRRVIPLRDFFAIDEKSFYADAAEAILRIVSKG